MMDNLADDLLQYEYLTPYRMVEAIQTAELTEIALQNLVALAYDTHHPSQE